MNQTEKEQLVKDLIKEDRYTTIKDYLEVVQEIESITPCSQETYLQYKRA